MTTKVTIEPAGHAIRVTTRDVYAAPDANGARQVTETDTILQPGDAPLAVYATTTRTISVVDLDA